MEPSKHKKNRILVFLEGGQLLKITENELLHHDLRPGADLPEETVEELNTFSKALLPTLSAAVAASGGILSASVRQVATVFFVDLLLSLIRGLLLPLVYFYVAAAAADAMLPGRHLAGISTAIRKGTVWLLMQSFGRFWPICLRLLS